MELIKHIVIVGGGFAGTTAIRQLDGQLPPGYELVIISEESYTTFNPLLPETMGASIFPEQVVAPIRELFNPGHATRFIMGRVVAADLDRRNVTCTTLHGELTVEYDQLVLACGNRARLDLIPGAAEHALPLKTVGDAMHVRNMVLRRLSTMELELDPAMRRSLGHFVVIGGGFSGVEVAGQLLDCLRSAARYYPHAGPENVHVTVVQDIDHLLPELPASLGEAAHRSLIRRGASVVLGKRASQVTAQGVALNDQFITASTVIVTIGTRPNALMEKLGLPLEHGRLRVQPDLSVAGRQGLWAMGDCALVPNSYDQGISPPTAQFAVRQGRQLAANLLARLQGRDGEAFNYRNRGMMAAIGHRKGVGEVYGVPLSGLLAWLAWRFYYLSQMPTLRRKLRVMMEWLWGAFFSVDLTHLRFTRSGGEVEPEDTPAASTGTAAGPPARAPQMPAPQTAPQPAPQPAPRAPEPAHDAASR